MMACGSERANVPRIYRSGLGQSGCGSWRRGYLLFRWRVWVQYPGHSLFNTASHIAL